MIVKRTAQTSMAISGRGMKDQISFSLLPKYHSQTPEALRAPLQHQPGSQTQAAARITRVPEAQRGRVIQRQLLEESLLYRPDNQSISKSSQMRFLLLFSRQGKLRLQKWFTAMSEREKKKIIREMTTIVLARHPRSCNFLQWKDLKIIYKRYASLYFCLGVEDQENELIALEVIHRYVELLDKYFGNVCELDIIFNFEKAYFILDEFLMGGEIQETSKQSVSRSIEASDMLQETMEEYMSKPAF